MKKIIFFSCIVFLAFSVTGNAQQNNKTYAAAARAYARGNDSYVQFSSNTYKAGKKYVVLKFWNEAETITEKEKTAFSNLKKSLVKKNVEVVALPWAKEEELKDALKKYNLTVDVRDGKHINLKGENITLNTTSGKALLVLEDGKPVTLCSGTDCEARAKTFFKLQTYN
jgi:hypothetical protein